MLFKQNPYELDVFMNKSLFFSLSALSITLSLSADQSSQQTEKELFFEEKNQGASLATDPPAATTQPSNAEIQSVVKDKDQQTSLVSDNSLETTSPPPAITQSSTVDQNYPGRNKPNDLFAAQPYPRHGAHLSAFGEFLYWNSGFNIHCAQLDLTTTNQIVTRELSHFNTHYQPGFRIGIQENFQAQGWDLVFDWTSFRNTKHKTFLQHGNVFPDLDWGNDYNEDVAPANSRSSYHARFNQLNLTLGKEVYFSKYYSFHPNMGVRYLSLKDGFKMHYFNLTNSQVNDISMDNNLHGFGLSAGVGNKFLLGYGLSLTGALDASLAYLKKSLHTKAVANELTGSFYGIDVTEPAHDIIPIVDLKVDLNWERSFMQEKLALELNVGYEYHVLINGFTMISMPLSGFILLAEPLNTNFYMMGLTLGAKLSF